MNTHARRWLAAATITATALTLAACDGNGEDPPTDPTTTESSADPSDDVTTEEPSPTAQEIPDLDEPAVPPEMLVDDATGAAAATWYFLQLYDYMRATGDLTLWDAMTSDECGWCATAAEQVVQIYSAGGRIDGPGLTYDIGSARVVLPDSDDPFYAVRLDVIEEPFEVIASDGTSEDRPGQSLEPLAVAVHYRSDRFEVVAVNFEAG